MTIAPINGCLHGRVRCLHMSVNPKCCLGTFWWLPSSNAFSAVLQDSSLCMFTLLRVPHWADGRRLSQPDVLDACDLNILMFTHLVNVNLMFNFPSSLLLIPANLLPHLSHAPQLQSQPFTFPFRFSLRYYIFCFCFVYVYFYFFILYFSFLFSFLFLLIFVSLPIWTLVNF